MRAGENREERRGARDLTCGARRWRNDAGGLQFTQSLLRRLLIKLLKWTTKREKGINYRGPPGMRCPEPVPVAMATALLFHTFALLKKKQKQQKQV